jgi:hypothetical protein
MTTIGGRIGWKIAGFAFLSCSSLPSLILIFIEYKWWLTKLKKEKTATSKK